MAVKTERRLSRAATDEAASPSKRRRGRSSPPSFRDLLAHLKTIEAEKLLGPRGKKLLGEAHFEVAVGVDTKLTRSSFQLRLPDAIGTIRLADAARGRLALSCSRCTRPCVHVAAALSVVLAEKLALGLAVPPSQRTPAEALGDAELVARALEDRAQRARDERMQVSSSEPK